MKTVLRWSLRILGGLLALLLVVLLGGWLWLRSSLPETTGEVLVAGAGAPVELWRDADGLLTVRAESWPDAAFGLGYAHAQDRLAQMVMLRAAGRGELSAVAGRSTFKLDLLMRTLGFARQAEAQVARLEPETRQLLEGYAAGVNAFIEGRSGALPPEFLAFGEPAPWQPADSLLWGKMMALRLSGNWREELRNARLAPVLEPGDRADLFPEEPAALVSTVPADGLAALAERTLFAAVPELLTSYGASNVWTVAGARTRSGKPVLANDPHLMLQAPSTWYLARLETPDGTVAGATSPGVPVVLIGHNERIAWGITTTHSDTQDFVIETLDPDDPSRYLTPDGARTFETRVEEIPVRGHGSEPVTIREARFGPVVGEAIDPDDLPALAADQVATLAWPALGGDDGTPDAMVRLNRARGWDDFREAMRRWVAPQQNVFYADVEGHIGFWSPGLVPVRVGYDGSLPVEGKGRAEIWSGFIPFESLPHALDPERGRLVNANNRIVGPGYPFSISTEFQNPARAERLETALAEDEAHGPAEAQALQLDDVSLSARRLLPLLLAAAPAEGEAAEAHALLSGWQGEMDRERPEPLLYHAWIRELNRVLFADELGARFGEIAFWNPEAIQRVLTVSPRWCRGQAADCEEALRKSLVEAIALLRRAGAEGPLAELQWGDFHRAVLAHPLLKWLPLAGELSTLSIPTSGGNYTVNRGTPVYLDESRLFQHVHGAGLRAVFDLADLDASRFVIDSGQSGNPLSPLYGNFLERWRDGDTVELVAPERESAEILVLRPASASLEDGQRQRGQGQGDSQ